MIPADMRIGLLNLRRFVDKHTLELTAAPQPER